MNRKLQTAGAGSRPGPAMTPAPPRTHGLTVVGWIVVCFSSMPLTMGVSGDGAGYAWIGLAMLAAGIAMVLIGGRMLRARRS